MRNRIPDDIRDRLLRLALDEPVLSPRELAVRFTDAERVQRAAGIMASPSPDDLIPLTLDISCKAYARAQELYAEKDPHLSMAGEPREFKTFDEFLAIFLELGPLDDLQA